MLSTKLQPISCTYLYVVVDNQIIVLIIFLWSQRIGFRVFVFFIQLTVVIVRRGQVVEWYAATVTLTFFKAFDWFSDRRVFNHVTKKDVVIKHISSDRKEKPAYRTISIGTCGQERKRMEKNLDEKVHQAGMYTSKHRWVYNSKKLQKFSLPKMFSFCTWSWRLYLEFKKLLRTLTYIRTWLYFISN